MADRRSLRRVEILKRECLGLVKPLWRTVVASGGSKYLKIERLELFKPLWRTVIASGGSKLSRVECLGLSSLFGRP